MKRTSVMLLAVSLLMAGAAQAQNALIDYQGYFWETGGFPPSNSTDVLSLVGVVDNIDPRFGVNFANEEVTLYVTNLVSTGQVDQGGGFLAIAYTGGDIELWRDPSKDHDYGSSTPVNPTSPSTFRNGGAFLIGTLSNFFLYFDSAPGGGTGFYSGDVVFTSGSGLATLGQLNANGFTFGGVLDRTASAGNIPNGYDLQADGTIEVQVTVGVKNESWGAIKKLYRR